MRTALAVVPLRASECCEHIIRLDGDGRARDGCEGGADGVHFEGTSREAGWIRGITAAGIPVMGHLGLTPQAINKFGTYEVRAQDPAEAKELLRDPRTRTDGTMRALRQAHLILD